MKDFRKLKVWEKAHSLTLAVYRAREAFPRAELFGITSQMRRASASIAANIAEGYGRGSDGELRHFLNTAAGSAFELEYFLLLAKDLGLLADSLYAPLQAQVIEIERMISGLLRTVSPTRPKDHRRPELAAQSS
jgi:four helix bundle protein